MVKRARRQKEPDFNKRMGSRLKIARAKVEDTTGERVCEVLGVSRQTWYNWEAGLRAFDMEIVREFCELYGIDLNWLYDMPTLMEVERRKPDPARRRASSN